MTTESTAIVAPAPAAAPVRRGVRHLVHCPPSWDHYLLAAPATGEDRFLLTGDMPGDHPLFNDGPGQFHDPLVVAEALQETGEFIGRQYFGIAADRPGLYQRFGLRLTDLAAWRTGPDPARMTVELWAAPTGAASGAPSGLDLRLDVSLDDVPCATGAAALAFAPAGRGGPGWPLRAAWPAPAVRPVTPAEVGRLDPANVVVAEPTPAPSGRLSTWVLPSRQNPALGAAAGGRLSGTLLLEAVRQCAVLTAGRAVGLVPERSVPAGCEIRFHGRPRSASPVRCAAVPGALDRDAAGRPAVPVTVTLVQDRVTVGEARTLVVQDF
ncbi:AfsA-related hotdog domain-containing protein [Kitasatospora sp. NPDC096204]|uniref:AfsA-related hotdog domain-containing protein n=1 Tax=Kitasatospora sp. NPDC096204 TaxID=3364094 RepID=UPI003807D893